MAQNNNIYLSGMVVGFEKNFTYRDIDFYKAILKVERLSGDFDYLPVVIPEHVCEGIGDLYWKQIGVSGELRSYNGLKTEPHRCYVVTYAKRIDLLDDPTYKNDVNIDGYLCRKPILRRTPLGKKIAEVCIAVQRDFGSTAYINCIAWGQCAKQIDSLPVGSQIKVSGRMQSRDYYKNLDGKEEVRTAYELSIFEMEVPNGKDIE